MKITFWRSNKPLEHRLAERVGEGVKILGFDYEVRVVDDYNGPLAETDVAIVLGVKGMSGYIMREHQVLDKHVIYIDKGYYRGRGDDPAVKLEYFRFSVDGFQPINYFQNVKRPSNRWDRLGFTFKPMQRHGSTVVYAGSSQKYCDFQQIGDATKYASKVVRGVRKMLPNNEIIYRPKPTWKDAVPIEGTTFSQRKKKIQEELKTAKALVTHGSNASFDSILAGVPCVVLGDAIAKPIAMSSLQQLRDIKFPKDEERNQWGCDLAYCQWTLDEMRSGEMWENLKEQLL